MLRSILQLLIAGLVLWTAGCNGDASNDPVIAGQDNAAASPPQGEDSDNGETQQPVEETHEFLTSDGVALHFTVQGSEEIKPRPAIIQFSPYGDIGRDLPDFGPEYNHVYVNVRGTGQSNGTWSAIGPRDQQDISEFLTWACEQPWSDGHFGLYGFSASAIAVYNAMHLPMPCVEAAGLLAGTNDLYRDLLYPGGMFNLAPGAAVSLGVGAPIIAGGFLDLFLAAQPPVDPILSGLGFMGTILEVLLHTTEDEFWQERAQRPNQDSFPVLAITGFYDVESRGPFESYKMLRDQGVPVHLRLFGGHDGFPEGTTGATPEFKRWYDRFLLGKSNGIDEEPPVQLLVGHGGYGELIKGNLTKMDAADWPVPGTTWQALYLNPERSGTANSSNDGSLGLELPAQSVSQPWLSLTSLPTATDPNTTATVLSTFYDSVPFLTQLALMEPLSITYTTAPFSEAVDVVGPASLDIFVTTVLPEADIHAVIADVWPDGSSHAVGIGRLRTSYPNIVEERSVRDGNGEVVQPYPDHSSKTPAIPGEMREYKVEFWPLGNRFQAGHRLRLYLVGSPLYMLPAPNINLASLGGDTPSRLLVPVLPGSSLADAIAPMSQ